MRMPVLTPRPNLLELARLIGGGERIGLSEGMLAAPSSGDGNITDPDPPGRQRVDGKMLLGTMWSFGINSLQQILVLTRLVILARLLLPSDFGILDIALLTLYALDVFSQTGFQQALVQKKTDITEDLNAAWTLLVVRGFVLFIVLFLFAPYIADFFATPEAAPVLQVVGITLIFQGFTNLGTILFLKNLDFRKQYLFKLSGVATEFIVSITAVLIFQNVWALVFGIIAKDLILMIMSYIIHPYRPRFNFDLKKVRGLSSYGIWIMASSILVFLLIQGDDIIVGKVLGITALGLYQMAYGLSNTPSTEISQIISQVAFPVYSKIQDDLAQLKVLFLRTLELTALISFVLTGLLVSLAPEITLVFLGSNWAPIIPLIQILAWWGVVRGLEETSAALFLAVGKPRLHSMLQFIQVIILFTLIYPLMDNYGLVGVSLAVAFSCFPVLFLFINSVKKILTIGVWEAYAPLVYPLALIVCSIGSTALVRTVLFPTPDLYSLFILLGTYALITLIVINVLDRFTPYKAVSMVRGFISSRKKAF